MQTENIKIHDTVCITIKHIDPSKTWYGGKFNGVVTEKGENEITIIKADSDPETFDLNEKGDYIYSIVQLSGIQYLNEIEKAVVKQEQEVVRQTERLADIKRWHQMYKNDISLLGRLYWFMKNQF